MTTILFFKASAIWIIIVLLAIGNGIFRESILVPAMGQNAALPISGISLSCIVFIVTYLAFPFFAKQNTQAYFLIGLQWVLMTLLFEFVFGHYVIGKPWPIIFQVFNIMKGDLFVIVLLTCLISPPIVAKIKSAIEQ